MSDHLLAQLGSLRTAVSAECKILHDSQDPVFKRYLARWSDINLKTPGAVVLPRSEDDCLKTELVPKSGGHSRWSTIGEQGIIIDLSHYTGVMVDAESQTATLTGGVLVGEVGERLAEKGLFTALGNSNTVGAIPYFLNGGSSLTSPLIGFGTDQILSARIITAAGGVTDVNDENHSDLLYALRGAGQFFGLVTQLVVRAYSISSLRKRQGLVWSGAFIFPLDRAAEILSIAKNIADNPEHLTVGMLMIAKPAPHRIPSLIVSVRLLGDEDPNEVFSGLYDLHPTTFMGSDVPIQNAGAANDALNAHGDFKRFGQAGLREGFLHECPDAVDSSFNLAWFSRPVKRPTFVSAMAVHDIRFWQTNVIWHTDPENREKVDQFNNECLALVRGPDESQDVDFQNGTRSRPIQLRQLKRGWDPKGVFTRQLLD
ncbi:FAD binding domain-containing protein [Aspergillus germanicus]